MLETLPKNWLHIIKKKNEGRCLSICINFRYKFGWLVTIHFLFFAAFDSLKVHGYLPKKGIYYIETTIIPKHIDNL